MVDLYEHLLRNLALYEYQKCIGRLVSCCTGTTVLISFGHRSFEPVWLSHQLCLVTSSRFSRVFEIGSGLAGLVGFIGAMIFVVRSRSNPEPYSWSFALDLTGCVLMMIDAFLIGIVNRSVDTNPDRARVVIVENREVYNSSGMVYSPPTYPGQVGHLSQYLNFQATAPDHNVHSSSYSVPHAGIFNHSMDTNPYQDRVIIAENEQVYNSSGVVYSPPTHPGQVGYASQYVNFQATAPDNTIHSSSYPPFHPVNPQPIQAEYLSYPHQAQAGYISCPDSTQAGYISYPDSTQAGYISYSDSTQAGLSSSDLPQSEPTTCSVQDGQT